MNKILSLVFIILLAASKLFSQDTLTPLSTLQKIKPGLYQDYDEFINNSPSIKHPFKVLAEYNDLTIDSTLKGYYYLFWGIAIPAHYIIII